MIKLDQIKLNVNDDEALLKSIIAHKLKINPNAIKDYSIIKKSIDARKKPDIFYVFSIAVPFLVRMKKEFLQKLKRIITSMHISLSYIRYLK